MRPAVCVTLALALLAPAARPPQPSSAPFVPVGVWYGGGTSRAPMVSRHPAAERDAWRRDLAAIKSLGFNSVKTWVDWASAEPERGRYRLDALEQLLSLSDEAGLRVIVQVYTDASPEWLGTRYPDSSFISDQGARIGSQASPGYCLDHAGVRADMVAFIAAVSTAAARHQSFYAIDVWSEPHLVNWVWFNTPVEFCYCPYTQGRFREWLKGKYRTVEAVNAAWYRTFSSWEEIGAPRFGTILSYTDFIDWKTFIATKLQEDLKLKADASAPRGARPVSSHSDAPAIMLSPLSGFGNPDDWWMTRSVDHYGTSIYPKHAAAATPWSPVRLTSALDGIRSAAGDRGWWMGELQAGQGATGVRVAAPVTGADLRLWGWAAISRGARALSYYAWYPMSSGYESNGYGMIDLDGTLTDRAKIAGEFAGVIGRNAALFAALRPHASRVAILYNRLSYMVGGNTVAPGTVVRNSMVGIYRALFEQNIQADFIHPDEVVAGGASKYAVIYLSYPVMLQQPVADALKAYVRHGGTLISEARPAWNDERGVANPRIPGGGLDETFGARERELRPAEPVTFTMERDLPRALAPLAGRTFNGLAFAEHLDVTGASSRVLARFARDGGGPGDPAIVLSPYGSGAAILIGTFPSAAFEQDPDKMRATGELLQRFVALAGVTPEIRIDGAPGLVEARFLESSNAILLIAINHGDSLQRVTFRFGPEIPEAIWQNMETGSAVNFVQGADGPTYAHTFAARDVMVLVRGKKLR
jgi:beta-galactosidase GanA